MDPAELKPQKARKPVPDKLFYKIGEVSKLTGVEPYVLRYWETEFTFLNPRKSRSGQRIYSKKDLDVIVSIKNLLYDERYTIEGVRKRLAEPGAIRRHSSEPLSVVSPLGHDSPNPPGEATVEAAAPVDLTQCCAETVESVKARLRAIIKSLD